MHLGPQPRGGGGLEFTFFYQTAQAPLLSLMPTIERKRVQVKSEKILAQNKPVVTDSRVQRKRGQDK